MARPPAHDREIQPRPPDSRLRRNVPVLGTTALFNDTASEMAYWVLPVFILQLGAGPQLLGVIEGVAESLASLARLGSGYLADRFEHRKPLVVAGYVAANIVKPLLALTTAWWQVLVLRATDRTAKGFRGAPRDVMIAESADPAKLGAAFGLRQAMDSAGAILGPGLAFLMMARWNDPRLVFWAAAIPGAICILIAIVFIRETGGRAHVRTHDTLVATPKLAPAAFPLAFYVLLVALTIFGVANFSDMFLILRAKEIGIRSALAPVLGLVFNVSYAGLSLPMGRLSDRLPRKYLVGGGYLLFAAVFSGFGLAHDALAIWILFVVYGVYYAATEGVIRALVVDLVGRDARGRALGTISFVSGIGALLASFLAGWLWRHHGSMVPFEFSAVLASISGAMVLSLNTKGAPPLHEAPPG